MPELPEVAGFKRYLDALALGQRIQRISVVDDRIVKGASPRGLKARLSGAMLEETVRHGKFLFVQLSTGGYLVLHFGMDGGLHYFTHISALPEYTRLLLSFTNGHHLACTSVRMLGCVSFTEDVERFIQEHNLGPDALHGPLTAEAFAAMLTGRGGAVKRALMNQSIVAGIGNIYADEILFQSRIHPLTRLDRLGQDELKDMFRIMRRVLRTAARHGGNVEPLPEGYLLRHRSPSGRCPECGGRLGIEKISGRRAYFCPRCQLKR